MADITLGFPRNQVTCILGPNGAGKTTLVKILASLVTPDAGSVSWMETPRGPRSGAIQGRTGLVTPNERSFYWRLTGRQNLAFFSSLHSLNGAVLRARVEEALAETGLLEDADKPYRLYSTGMKQKLNIARALLGDPELYLLDEPASHLDPLAREDFWKFIETTLIGKRGATVVLCTHDLEEARRLADLVVVLDHGRIVEQGTPGGLSGLMQAGAELELLHAGPVPERWLETQGDAVRDRSPGRLRLALDPAGASQEELIRSFVLGGGRLLEARHARDDLLELLNRRIRPDA